MAAATLKNFGLRFFYRRNRPCASGLDPETVHFAFVCLLCSIWRVVDLLVQVELTEKYENSPIVRADNTLMLLKKETQERGFSISAASKR
ncbi:MAG: hypothetical protein J07HQX50_01159 [Haloquadratum sp. J07HQX50]|nr:MAG: hypothetical protein J07HQX50_01159 [Haloquadratum sp. J07HQX50]